jgi:hypothetical protein
MRNLKYTVHSGVLGLQGEDNVEYDKAIGFEELDLMQLF